MKENTRIEAIPPDEITKIISSHDPTKDYKKGAYIDAHDGTGWRVGIITKEENGAISIHYEGWGPKFDENGIKISSARIAPFRKMTVGYTGQVRQAYRDFKYTKEQKYKVEAGVKEIMASSFTVADPFKYTQFVRGELFFYVDSLLTSINTFPPSADAFEDIADFLRLVLSFIVLWAKISADLIGELEAGEKWELLYLVHSRTAVALSHREFIQLLAMFLAPYERATDSFKVIAVDRTVVVSAKSGPGSD